MEHSSPDIRTSSVRVYQSRRNARRFSTHSSSNLHMPPKSPAWITGRPCQSSVVPTNWRFTVWQAYGRFPPAPVPTCDTLSKSAAWVSTRRSKNLHKRGVNFWLEFVGVYQLAPARAANQPTQLPTQTHQPDAVAASDDLTDFLAIQTTFTT